MTHNITKTALFSIVVLGTALFCGCNRQEKELFDMSGTERTEAAMTKTAEILTSAENGWEMHYFTNPEGQGHVLLFKFEKNGIVTIAAKNEVTSNKGTYKSAQSIWAMDASQGPVLSMKTYNDVFSVFADPQSDGLGYEGDYEFIVISADSDQIELMGKKNRARCIMTPVESGVAWDTFFAPIDRIKAYTFSGNNGMQFQLVVDDKTYLPLEYNDMAMTETVQNAYVFPLIVTRTGVDFYDRGILFAENQYAKHFVLNDELTKLVCTDEGVNAYIRSAFTIPEYFHFRLSRNNEWQISATENGSAAQAAYNAFAQGLKSTNATLNYLAFTTKADNTLALHIRFTVSNQRYDGYYTLTTSEDGNKIAIAYSAADTNGEAALKRAGGNNLNKGIALLNNIISGTFTLSSVSGSTLNIQQMYMLNESNPEHVLKIFVK